MWRKKLAPKVYIAVAPGAVYDYPTNRTDYIVEVKKQAVVKKEALEYVKNMNCDKYCLYSDEDDNNKEKFTRFINDTKSKEIYLKYYNHFDGYHNIYKIPELNELINNLLWRMETIYWSKAIRNRKNHLRKWLTKFKTIFTSKYLLELNIMF